MSGAYRPPDFERGRDLPTDTMSLGLNRGWLNAAERESLAKPDVQAHENNAPVVTLQDGMRPNRRTVNPNVRSR